MLRDEERRKAAEDLVKDVVNAMVFVVEVDRVVMVVNTNESLFIGLCGCLAIISRKEVSKLA